MPLILSIETSTEICSVAVGNEHGVLASMETHEPYQHASVLTSYIQQVLQQASVLPKDLHAVAISAGPGSYTGLRIGSSTAKGLCFALNIPLLAVNTLQYMCSTLQKLHPDENSLYGAMLDARRMEVYVALYDFFGHPILSPISHILNKSSFLNYIIDNKNIIFSGNGTAKAKQILDEKITFCDIETTSAINMLDTAQKLYNQQKYAEVAYFEPFYLKPPNITNVK
jgi:tRNA threonylcarbamoyladenosine biosynthesis protein TsaB